MPRVLHILNELRPSGAETMLRAAASYWQSQGIDGAILVTGESLGSYAEALSQSGYRLYHLPFRRSAAYLACVFRFLRDNEFDGVHIHCERANFWYALLAYCAGRRHIVRSVHSLFRFRGWLRLRRFVQRLLLRVCLRVQTVAVSASVQKLERDVYANPVLNIPNWFDAERFRPPLPRERESARERLGIPNDAFAIVSVGNCSPVKNHEAIIEALSRLPEHVLYLHVGCEDIAQSDRALADSVGVTNRIRFLGPIDDVATVLQASDLFVMPSRYEGLGIAAVEALAAGLVAVFGDVEGLRELRNIAPECEWVLPESGAIAAAILRLSMLSAMQRRSLGAVLSARVHQAFSMQRGAAQYAELYARGAAA